MNDLPRIEDYFPTPELRERLLTELKGYDVVIGHDREVGPNHGTAFYGRAALERVVKVGRPERLRVAHYSYSSSTISLEMLAAACLVAFGSCEYESAQEREAWLEEMRRAWSGEPPTAPPRP